METKIIAMKEWTEAANKLIMGMGLKRGQIREMVRQAKPLWRDGIKEFMEVLKIKGIPLLVFSAGLGDLIQEIFNQSTSLPKLSSMHIVSNFMKFNKTTTTCSSSTSSSDDDDLVVVGFSEPVIHVFNKNEGHIDRKSSYFIDHVKGKRNVGTVKRKSERDVEKEEREERDIYIERVRDGEFISTSIYSLVLLGDSLGDPHMADGLEHDVVLKIGFCNRDEDKMLPIYLEKYDLVLTGDPGLHLVTDLLKSIL